MAQAARDIYYERSYRGSAARQASPARQGRPVREPRPDVRVIPGTRSDNPALQSISPEFARAFKVVLVLAVLVASLCAVRVWLSVGTVTLLEQGKKLESTLVTAQAASNELEIQHSILAGSARIETEAANIGMVAPADVKYIKVAVPGKIVTNPDGSISLSSTLRNVEECALAAAQR